MGYGRVGLAETDLWVSPIMLQLAWNIVIFGKKGSRDVIEWAELSTRLKIGRTRPVLEDIDLAQSFMMRFANGLKFLEGN